MGKPGEIKAVLDVLVIQLLSEHFTPNYYIAELHLVACQGSCLISQNILDLSELFINADCVAFHTLFVNVAIHFFVNGHEIALEHFHKLKGYNQ